MINTLIADDHHLVRKGIRALLENVEDIHVLDEAADGLQAVKLVRLLAPNVVLMDIFMPGLNGVQALERINSLKLGTRVVMLSMYKNETLIRQSMRAGARGFLLKSSVVEELILAVRAAARGEIYLSPAISEILVKDVLQLQATEGDNSLLNQLTLREREVMQLIAEGNTNNSTARILKISQKTVEKHRTSLMKKLDIQNLAALIRMAIRFGLIVVEN